MQTEFYFNFINSLFLKAVCKSYQEVIKVLFIITTTGTSLPQKSTTRTSTPVALSIWKFPQVAFLYIIHSLYTVQQPTNQMDRDVILWSPLVRQMRGLSLVLWERRINFGAQWTGIDIVLRWCEAKPANFPGWKPFQSLYRFHLNLKVWICSIRNKATQFTAFPVSEEKLINFCTSPSTNLFTQFQVKVSVLFSGSFLAMKTQDTSQQNTASQTY